MINEPKNIEELVINLLKSGSISTTILLEKIQEKRPGTTKQAFYQTLRKLKKEEVVVVRGKRVSLSHIWISNMSEFFEAVRINYSGNTGAGEEFLLLGNGEKISYSFKNPHTTDIFWGHAFGILLSRVDKKTPICIYNPHEWFMVAREESEKKLFSQIKNEGKVLQILVGEREELDIKTGEWFLAQKLQYFATKEKIFDKRNYYINIFDDFIIEAWLDPKTTKELDDFYVKNKILNEVSKKELENIVSKKGTNKLTISRNKRKAQKVRNIFKKYFI